jgi:hypothetical protein
MLAKAIALLPSKSLLSMHASMRFSTQHQRFPNHKELFADDYYDENTKKNPYAKGLPNTDDFESYDRGTHRSTPTGILANYKKQINLTP